MSLKLKIATAFSLGVFNLLRVFKYRIGVKTRLNPVQKLSATMPSGNFFADGQNNVESKPKIKHQTLTAFGYLNYQVKGTYPDWFYSPLTQQSFANASKPWYQIPDFDANVGDIKGVWEASRFDWVLEFAVQAKAEQNDVALQCLDDWLNNWCQHNPAYMGPNWKCGQEASIRVMHLVAALIGLGQLDKTSANVLLLIEVHLQRIAPTIDYAIAQDNNHGTSEAAALFIGGAVLDYIKENSKYKVWQTLGRKWLENRADQLIMQDGGFSQYSVNYHRVMLDSYYLAEIVRQKLNLTTFSKDLYQQVAKATDWLYVLTQESGDVPNLGANDGARLLPVSTTDYRDFRPTVQLGSTLFHQHSYYQDAGSYDQILMFFVDLQNM
ncbi:MAG: weeF, partial [Moraxellaceae bacterium]